MTIRLFNAGMPIFVLVVLWGCSKKSPAPNDVDTDPERPTDISLQALSEPATDGSSVNWDATLAAAAICTASYLDGPAEEKTLRDFGFKSVKTFQQGSSHAVVCSTDELVVVVFRGTDELADWVINADLRREKVRDGHVHRGFYEAMNSLYAGIVATIKEQYGGANALCVTGHSLGGAMALLFAYEFTAKEDLEISSLITFGQPLSLSGPLAEYTNNLLGFRYRRFVNGSDVVTRLLPKFHHAGSRVHLTATGVEIRPPKVAYRSLGREKDAQDDPEAMTEEEFRALQAQLRSDASSPVTENDAPEKANAIPKGHTPWIRDHSMQLYESRIRELRAGEN